MPQSLPDRAKRRGPESNRRIAVLQTAALPLGYRAEEPSNYPLAEASSSDLPASGALYTPVSARVLNS